MTRHRTYAKTYRFRRLPAPRHEPREWEESLKGRGLANADWWVPAPLDQAQSRTAVATYLPELLPDYDALCTLRPGDAAAAQFLAQYNLKPWWAGCSQSISRQAGHQTLIRNYDLGLDEFSDTFTREPCGTGGWMLGSSESGWGYLDGVNDRGLAVSITFGGRFVTGDGFSVPMVTRYLLQTCATTAEALAALGRLPFRLAQNFLLLDRNGQSAVAYTSPDRGLVVPERAICCTNQQEDPVPPEQEAFTRTGARLAYLESRAGAVSFDEMFSERLYNRRYDQHLGTLYTVEYDPVAGTARYAWPGQGSLVLGHQTPETEVTITLEGEVPAQASGG